MITLPNFDIKSSEPVSKEFVEREIFTFYQASQFVKQLPYGRNADKNNLATVFADNCGTCSTKHALLKQLAEENHFKGLKLIVGLFKMNGINTPEILATLDRNQLEYIPEAHCYLKYNNYILDYTKENFALSTFTNNLIEEIEINANQITEYKVNYHKNYLTAWLDIKEQANLSLTDIWKIREQCILDLTQNKN